MLTELYTYGNWLSASGLQTLFKHRVAILLRQNILYTSLTSSHADIIGVQVGNTSIIACYASPNEPIQSVLDAVSQILTLCTPHHIILSD